MQVKFQLFKSAFSSWESLCQQAADFASAIGKDRFISISVSEDHNEGVIIVWYWE